LNGNNACRAYFTGKKTFTKWERRDAYAWIMNPQDDILCSEGVQQQAAWRIAVEAWMNEGLYHHYRQGESVTLFFIIN
jgi:hypothetical protein